MEVGASGGGGAGAGGSGMKGARARCCGALCYLDSEECEGEVDVIDEDVEYDADGNVDDTYWVHACEFHAPQYGGRP